MIGTAASSNAESFPGPEGALPCASQLDFSISGTFGADTRLTAGPCTVPDISGPA